MQNDNWGSSAGSDGEYMSPDGLLSDADGGEDGLDVASSAGGSLRTPVPAEKRARRGASPAPSSVSGTPGALALAVRTPPAQRLQRPTPPPAQRSRKRAVGAESADVAMTCMMCLGNSK
eukprot:9470432-Pyramimonas_sp.AAC.2